MDVPQRRIDLTADGAAQPSPPPAAPPHGDSIERFDVEVRNALAALVGATTLLYKKWDGLSDDRRRALAESAARRAEELQTSLLPVLSRLRSTASRR